VYTIAQIRPDPRWTLTAGIRGDWLRSSIDDPYDIAPRSSNDDLRAFSPTAGVNYALPGGNAFVSYAGSFKAPTLEQLYDQRPYFVDFDGPGPSPPFVLRLSSHGLEPQRGHHVEGGFRTRLGSGLWGDAPAYYAHSSDEIGFDLASFRVSNIEKSIHYGIEGQIELAEHSGWSGSLSYAWTIAEFDGGAHDGKQINTVPEHQVFARASYAHRWGGSVTGELSYVARQWIDEDNLYELDPYAVGNVGLTQEVGSAEVFLSVRNLFDERYATLGYVTIDEFGNDLALYYPAQRRSYRLGLRFDLDAFGGASD